MASRKVVTAADLRQIIAILEARCDTTDDFGEEMEAWERLQIAYAELARLTDGDKAVRAELADTSPLGAQPSTSYAP